MFFFPLTGCPLVNMPFPTERAGVSKQQHVSSRAERLHRDDEQDRQRLELAAAAAALAAHSVAARDRVHERPRARVEVVRVVEQDHLQQTTHARSDRDARPRSTVPVTQCGRRFESEHGRVTAAARRATGAGV